MFSSRSRITVFLGTAALTLAAGPGIVAAQTTLTFSQYACTGQGPQGNGTQQVFPPLDVQGFHLASSSNLAVPCDGNRYYVGQAVLVPGSYGQTVTLTKTSGTSGAPFSISSVDLANYFLNAPTNTVTFTGTQIGGQTVTQSFDVLASSAPTLATFMFQPTFANLASLTFTENASMLTEFTNLRLDQPTQGGGMTSTPEPGTWALLGTGLLVLGGMSVRRRRDTTV